MPVYDYVCEDCKIRVEEYRELRKRHDPIACPLCNEQMQLKIMSGMFVLNRQKPGSFKFERGKLDANEDRLHGLRTAEAKGPQEFRKLEKAFGPKICDEVKTHYKEHYAS